MKSFFDWFRETINPKSARSQQEEQGDIQATEMKVDARLDRFTRLAETSVNTSNEIAELVEQLVKDLKREARNAKTSARNSKN